MLDQVKTLLTCRELDAFRTKGVSLLKNHVSVKSLVELIKNTPIDSKETSSMITLQQRLTLPSGKHVIIKGAFKRHPKGSIPISESFEVNNEI